MVYSLGTIYHNADSSALTVAVIGIALALPAGLYILLSNAQNVVGGWNQGVQVSLYLKQSTGNAELQKLSSAIARWPEVARTRTITPAEGVAEFKHYSGLGAAIDTLGSNPLPPVIIVYPRLSKVDPVVIKLLIRRLRTLPEVDHARLDLGWVQRLFAILDFVQRLIWIVGGVLGIGVLMIVGNTIRLDVLNRCQEIEVSKLIGATDAFIRRPFLYRGLWLGFLGGLVAVILVELGIGLLATPVQRLSAIYGSGYHLHGLGFEAGLILLGLGSGLGLAGSWLAVGRHLRRIEPR